MITPRPRYGITRIDQPKKNNHGFYVRITFKGKAYRKFFPDKSSGGKAEALTLARQYRDEVLSKLPRSKQKAAARKPRKILQCGVIGVTHVLCRVGDGHEYEYWQAAWFDSKNKQHTVKYSINRYGSEKALELAKQARRTKSRISVPPADLETRGIKDHSANLEKHHKVKSSDS